MQIGINKHCTVQPNLIINIVWQRCGSEINIENEKIAKANLMENFSKSFLKEDINCCKRKLKYFY